MKILHVYKSYPPETHGGVEQFIHALSTGFQAKGHEVAVAVCAPRTIEYPDTFPYPVYRFATSFNYASCPVSTAFFRHFRALSRSVDVVHFHYPWPFADLCQLMAPSPRPKTVLTYHADIVKQKYLKYVYAPLQRWFLQQMDQIVVSSEALKRSATLAALQKKTQVIPVGIEPSRLLPPSAVAVQKWRSRVGDNFLLFIGQFRYYKGLKVLLHALKAHPVPTVLLGDGPEAAELRQLVHTLRLPNIHFVGAVPDADKGALLSLCRGVVLPSILRSEAFGLALIEGMAYSKPLISTELGTGTSIVNRHGETGFVVPACDPLALSGAIAQLFAEDALAQQMGAAAFQRYQDHYHMDAILQRYEALYAVL